MEIGLQGFQNFEGKFSVKEIMSLGNQEVQIQILTYVKNQFENVCLFVP